MAVYDLENVKAVALQQKINYGSRKVQVDMANLDYELNDVADCLSKLTATEFRKAHEYNNRAYDEYICTYTKIGNEVPDELYVKFCLLGDCLSIELISFHLPQF